MSWFDKVKEALNDAAVYLTMNGGLKLVLALITLVVGVIVIKILMAALWRRKVKNDQLKAFLLSLLRVALYIILLLIVCNVLGIPMSTFLVVLGSLSVAVALALQSSLGNFFGGILLLINRPFKIGDHVIINSAEGTVKRIGLMSTFLRTADSKLIIIPNSECSGAKITNLSFNLTRRLDTAFIVDVNSDVEKIRQVLCEYASSNELILGGGCKDEQQKPIEKKPLNLLDSEEDDGEYIEQPPALRVVGFSASGIELSFRVWVKTNNYWTLYFELNEQLIKLFKDNNIVLSGKKLQVVS